MQLPLLLLLLSLSCTNSFSGPTKRPNPTIIDKTILIQPGTGKYVYQVSDNNFTSFAVSDSVGEGPLFIEFYTKWCGHCKQLAPIWERLADELRGRVRVAAMDISENPITMEQLGVTAFPTLMYIQKERIYTYAGGGTRSLGALKQFALGGFNEFDWKGLEPPRTEPGPSIGMIRSILHRILRIMEVCFFFWTRATMPSIITFFVGVVVGIVATVIATKAAGNRHLAELEDELIDRLNELEEKERKQGKENNSVEGNGGDGQNNKSKTQ